MLKTYQDLMEERNAVIRLLPILQATRDAAVTNYTNAYERSLTLTRMIREMADGVVEVKASIDAEKKADPAPLDPLPIVK